MDFELSDEQRLIKNTAREFTDREIVERSRENARNHHFDLELVKKIADQGYLGAIVPAEYGGGGGAHPTHGRLVQENGPRRPSALGPVSGGNSPRGCSALHWGAGGAKRPTLPHLCSC